MKRLTVLTIFILLASLLAACASGPGALDTTTETPLPDATETPLTPTPMDGGEALPESIKSARQLLADLLQIDTREIIIKSITEQEFTDSCLGLGGPAESCLQALTPGFVVEMTVGDMSYTFHVAGDGSAVRLAKPEALRGSLQALLDMLQVEMSQLGVTKIIPQEFSDSCLGLGGPAESCLQALTPGFIIELTDGKLSYVFHASEDGTIVRLAQPEALRGAFQTLNAMLGIGINEVIVNQITPKEFRDGCLEVYEPDVMCTDVITPGYIIDLTVAGSHYVIHTNQDGSVVKLAETDSSGSPAPDGTDPLVALVTTFLAGQLGASPDALALVSIEPVDWPDACLGIQEPGVGCATVITPGYRVVVEAGGTQYILRTDLSGSKIVLEK